MPQPHNREDIDVIQSLARYLSETDPRAVGIVRETNNYLRRIGAEPATDERAGTQPLTCALMNLAAPMSFFGVAGRDIRTEPRLITVIDAAAKGARLDFCRPLCLVNYYGRQEDIDVTVVPYSELLPDARRC